MTGHPYCTHDEGEPCHCAAELFTQHIEGPVSPRRSERPHRRTQVCSHAQRRAEVRRLLQQGLTATVIARQTGMHVRTVERHMAGLKKEETSV